MIITPVGASASYCTITPIKVHDGEKKKTTTAIQISSQGDYYLPKRTHYVTLFFYKREKVVLKQMESVSGFKYGRQHVVSWTLLTTLLMFLLYKFVEKCKLSD